MAVARIDAGESYGSPESREWFTRFHTVLVREFSLSARPSLLAQSRGALMLYNWAAEHPQHVRSVGCIYPVCDLRSYPGLDVAASAYGLAPAELEAELAVHNPIDRLAPLATAGIPILHLHGNCDEVVPLEENTAELAARYRALGSSIEAILVPGLGHEYPPCPQFFESQQLLKFLVS